MMIFILIYVKYLKRLGQCSFLYYLTNLIFLGRKWGITVQYTDERNSGLFSVNVTTAFSTPGTLIAVLSGHAHCDDAKKVNGINYVQIVCAYIDVVNDYSGYKNRPAFSEKAYAFDIGIVDTENRTLKLKRIGYGTDRDVSY